jgi:hypothetical protein
VYRGECINFLRLYVVCRRVKCVYTWVVDGQIVYTRVVMEKSVGVRDLTMGESRICAKF